MRVDHLTHVGNSVSQHHVVNELNGNIRCRIALDAGIHRLSMDIDARRFDWERLYLPMDRFGNAGERTGPWDFDLRVHNQPVLPAWWVWVNGRRLGLVATARPGPAQLRHRKLKLDCCFEVRSPGIVDLALHPFNDVSSLVCLHARVWRAHEHDPALWRPTQPVERASLAGRQASSHAWERWRAVVEQMGGPYQRLMPRLIEAAKCHGRQRTGIGSLGHAWATVSAEPLPMLAFAHLAYHDDDARAQLLETVEEILNQRHWGNPDEAGYGHNGDLHAAARIEPLSFVYHWAGPALREAGLLERLRRKLDAQMSLFHDQMLLHENYWGGSLLQDHGLRSAARFGVAACNMLGVLDDAPRWLAVMLNRMDRVVDALPTDGAIPFTSYHKVHLYMDDLTAWRDTLLMVAGRDIFDDHRFVRVVEFVVNRLHEPSLTVMTALSRGDRIALDAGWGFFNALARRHHDPRAARLTQILVERYSREGVTIPLRAVATALTMIEHHAGVAPAPLQPEPFDARLDSGLVNYRPRGGVVNVSIRCAAPPALSSHFKTPCPCDHLTDAPLDGHFTVAVGDQTLLLTAEGGYRQRSALGCVLHIDGRGPFGDDGFAMGVPDMPYRGQHVEAARFDPTTQSAYVRLLLTPVYPRTAAVFRYQREFLLRPDGLTMRDLLVSELEHTYQWHFQTYRRRTITPDGDYGFCITDGAASIRLRASVVETPVISTIADTPVVWAYADENARQPFRHIAFRTTVPARTLTAEFAIAWRHAGEKFTHELRHQSATLAR